MGIKACAISVLIADALCILAIIFAIRILYGRQRIQKLQSLVLFLVASLHVSAAAVWKEMVYNESVIKLNFEVPVWTISDVEIGVGYFLLITSTVCSIVAFLLQALAQCRHKCCCTDPEPKPERLLEDSTFQAVIVYV